MKRPLLLSGLSDDEQRDLLAAAQPRHLKSRDVLGRQGDPADLFALVQLGHLKLGRSMPPAPRPSSGSSVQGIVTVRSPS